MCLVGGLEAPLENADVCADGEPAVFVLEANGACLIEPFLVNVRVRLERHGLLARVAVDQDLGKLGVGHVDCQRTLDLKRVQERKRERG